MAKFALLSVMGLAMDEMSSSEVESRSRTA